MSNSVWQLFSCYMENSGAITQVQKSTARIPMTEGTSQHQLAKAEQQMLTNDNRKPCKALYWAKNPLKPVINGSFWTC